MIPTSFPSKEEIARLTARAFLEIGAVHFNAREPFTLASGLPSPTYIDCRKLISYPRIRSTLMDFLAVTVMREAGFEAFYTLDPATGDRVYLAVVHEPGQPSHLRTRHGGAWTDHLLALAPCGLTEHLIA